MPQSLVKDDGNRVGQVKGTDIFAHGDADIVFRYQIPDLLGETGGLFAKYQKVVGLELYIAVAALCFSGGKEKAPLGILLHYFGKAVMIMKIQVLPVVKAGSFKMLVIRGKAQRPHQM